MKGDRVEAVVDTGQGVQRFDIVASRAGRRIEVTTSRGVVEVTEVTRGGTPVRTGRFMASRLIALVEHPAVEDKAGGVDVSTRRRMSAPEPERGRDQPGASRSRSGAARRGADARAERKPAESAGTTAAERTRAPH
ncbi:MAG TPA: hypothetical protein VGC90_03585 [Candidatus Limnocylindrales bacterium]